MRKLAKKQSLLKTITLNNNFRLVTLVFVTFFYLSACQVQQQNELNDDQTSQVADASSPTATLELLSTSTIQPTPTTTPLPTDTLTPTNTVVPADTATPTTTPTPTITATPAPIVFSMSQFSQDPPEGILREIAFFVGGGGDEDTSETFEDEEHTPSVGGYMVEDGRVVYLYNFEPYEYVRLFLYRQSFSRGRISLRLVGWQEVQVTGDGDVELLLEVYDDLVDIIQEFHFYAIGGTSGEATSLYYRSETITSYSENIQVGENQGSLMRNETVTGSLAKRESHSWTYAGEPGNITIILRPIGNFSGRLAVYDSELRLIQMVDLGHLGEATISVFMPGNDEYIIGVWGMFGWPGEYSLTIQ